MKRIIEIIVVSAVALGLTACRHYSYETVENDPTKARIYTLDNGLKVYAIVNKDKPRIDAQVAVKVGSKNDPRETTGLAHYFEHLMFKGTRQFGTQNYEAEKPLLDSIETLFELYRQTQDKTLREALYHQIDSLSYEASKISIPNEYDKLMASIGGSGTNAYTSYDVTCYVENIPSNQIELWAKVQSDRFQNCVLRGFHTELETIYEEFNMYNAQDQTKWFNALFSGLFEKHPYNTDVIGLPSHLKNPSITNVKKYHDEWYVPNNMAVVLSGDFDPDKAIKVIDKYFGVLEPNENLKRMQFEAEAPIKEPIVKEVTGLEAPLAVMGWRFPGENSDQTPLLNAFAEILQNGKAGLIDLDVNQRQKTLGMYSGVEGMADYSVFLVIAEPKPGQTLDQLKDIALAEIEKIKAGDFDESLLDAAINNLKLKHMYKYESTEAMAYMAVNSFINDIPWQTMVNEGELLSQITKDDIVRFANDNFSDNYVFVKKLQGTPEDDGSKIDKPAITPIFTNRDTSSAFLCDFQRAAAQVEPIEPVFVDYARDLSVLDDGNGVKLLYKQNVTNERFELDYMFETGSYADKLMPLAGKYFEYLGTRNMTPEQVKQYLYSLACSVTFSCSGENSYVSVSGLAENMDKAIALMEELIADAQPNPEALVQLKANTLQERINAKADQYSNAFRLYSYSVYGAHNPYTNVLSNAELNAVADQQLIDKIRSMFSLEHKILYYGPMDQKEFVDKINRTHKCPEEFTPVVKGNPYQVLVPQENTILIAPYDANQSILRSVSSRGEKFDLAKETCARAYNEYFGGGMNSIVFQEMREARGLAYSAAAWYSQPSDLEHTETFANYIQTQNDKLVDALAAFDGIIENMPVSQKAFDIAKQNIISNLRTQRTVKEAVLWSYVNAQKLGIDSSIDKMVYEQIADLTLDDVVRFQQQNVKGRNYTISILGRESDFDMAGLEKFGKIKKLSAEEIFGY